jgi:hypothetical protein
VKFEADSENDLANSKIKIKNDRPSLTSMTQTKFRRDSDQGNRPSTNYGRGAGHYKSISSVADRPYVNKT